MKPVVLIIALMFSQFLFATPRSTITKDHQLQVLYSELRFVESESLRVEFTIEVLEERLYEIPLPEDPAPRFST